MRQEISTSSEPPRLLTVKQFAEAHPAFTVGSLRWLRFEAAGADPLGLGAAGAFVEVGRRVLVHEQRFFAAIEAAQQSNSRRAARGTR